MWKENKQILNTEYHYHIDEQDNFAGKPLTSKFSVPHSSKNSRIGYAAEPTVM